MAKKLPPLAPVGARCAINGYVAVLATTVIDKTAVPAYLRTASGPMGDRFTYIHSIERESRANIDIELVDGTHYRCGEHMTVFVPEEAAALAGIAPPQAAA